MDMIMVTSPRKKESTKNIQLNMLLASAVGSQKIPELTKVSLSPFIIFVMIALGTWTISWEIIFGMHREKNIIIL